MLYITKHNQGGKKMRLGDIQENLISLLRQNRVAVEVTLESGVGLVILPDECLDVTDCELCLSKSESITFTDIIDVRPA